MRFVIEKEESLMRANNKKTALKLVGVCLLPLLFLSGCHANGHYSSKRDISKYTDAIDSRASITRENALEAMALYERLYARNTGDKTIAVKYAEALRKAGYPEQASTILSPLVNLKMSTDSNILLEYAMANIEAGDFKNAEKPVDKVLEFTGKKLESAVIKAKHLKAIILSAKGKYKEAEKYYREALDVWSGDPVPVMNNLALNLAEQGDFEGATNILKQAAELTDSADVVTSNIKLVKELQARIK